MELRIENLTKTFDKTAIINQANFTFEKGKIYGLLGRNGAGKTTLFNCIAKNLLFEDGSISIDGEANYDNTEIALVQATPRVPPFMTGYEFVRFFIDINQARMKRIKTPGEYLEMVGIKQEDQHRLMKDYSHGMQNKVQMVVSMMVQPPVLLLDEPLTSFDVVAAHEMKELIISMKSESIVIFSTHILQLAQDLCDEIVLLHNGQLKELPEGDLHKADFEEEVIRLLTDDVERQEEFFEESVDEGFYSEDGE